MSPNLLAELALREAYKESLADTKYFADKLKSLSEKKKDIRKQLADLPAEGSKKEEKAIKRAERRGTKSPVDKRNELESKLDTYKDRMAELQQLLQNAMQRQKEFLSTISNMSKMLHGTAMNTINKIG